LGEALLDAGATVVLGSHPHVLQPIVSSGRGVIAYSLGNFLWHPRSGPTGETGVLEVRFQGSRVTGHTLHPHVLDRAGAPVPADPATAARISERVSEFCIEVEPTPTRTATATAVP
jgi:poly-gamma-glutamate synthesis protein (capsule biosynthesis protein)